MSFDPALLDELARAFAEAAVREAFQMQKAPDQGALRDFAPLVTEALEQSDRSKPSSN